MEGASRFGKYGEIMPQVEFYGLMKVSDAFDLVLLEKGFTAEVRLNLMHISFLRNFQENYQRVLKSMKLKKQLLILEQRDYITQENLLDV
jgi:hypothetical protein